MLPGALGPELRGHGTAGPVAGGATTPGTLWTAPRVGGYAEPSLSLLPRPVLRPGPCEPGPPVLRPDRGAARRESYVRFIIAAVVVVLAAVTVGLGVAQRTVLAPPSSVTSEVTTSGAPVTIVPASALQGHDGRQTVRITGGDEAFAAYARTTDVEAWVGDARHDVVSWDDEAGELASRTVTGTEDSVPDPAGSDLWYREYEGSDLAFTIDVPDDVSLVVASDGTAAAPDEISVTWPLSTATPAAGPLIAGGLVLLAIGLGLYVWALRHHRRLRGPRRRGGDGGRPVRASRRSSRKALQAAGPGRVPGQGGGRRSRLAVVPVVLVGALALSGCSADYWPSGASEPASTPTPSTTTAPPEADEIQPPVLTAKQAERVVGRIAATAAEADAALDATAAGTRFTGPALEQRTAAYALRTKDPAIAGPPAIPAGDVTLTLPQQADTWPRTAFVVVQGDDAAVAPVALTLLQEDAREPYKVLYLTSLEAQATLPTVAPAVVGAARLAPDVKLLKVQPDQIAADYADILRNGDESEFAALFQSEGDTLREKIGKPYKDAKRAALPTTATIDYASNVADSPAVALATNDAGAIVSVALEEVETVKPAAAGAEVNPAGQVKTLLGIEKSTKGVEATYGVQLLFSVPPVGSDDGVVLLGFSQSLVSAKELP